MRAAPGRANRIRKGREISVFGVNNEPIRSTRIQHEPGTFFSDTRATRGRTREHPRTKQENQKLLISAKETRFAPLDENSKRSYVRLIAALCKKAGLDPNGSGTVGKITDASHELGKPVSNSTVLKLMVQVDDELTGKLRERAAAPGAAERKGARVERRKRSKEI